MKKSARLLLLAGVSGVALAALDHYADTRGDESRENRSSYAVAATAPASAPSVRPALLRELEALKGRARNRRRPNCSARRAGWWHRRRHRRRRRRRRRHPASRQPSPSPSWAGWWKTNG